MNVNILIIAKAPVPGLAKTRLCPPATSVQAAEIAAASLLDTVRAAKLVPGGRVVVAMTGNLADAVCRAEILSALDGVTVLPQRGSTLGQRIAAAHADTWRRFPGVPVLQIGMDTPQVTPELLGSSADRLASTDSVLGPAMDGGWWALGLRDPRLAVAIQHVPTSLADTGERTLIALREAGLRVGSLPMLSDVDTMKDALQVAASLPDSRFATTVLATAGVLL